MEDVSAKRKTMLLAILLIAEVACAGEYDYFRNIQYPPVRRPDVALDQVEQDGGTNATGYQRRVVTWWPKKGVDVVDAPDGVELRTWTVRTPEMEPLVEVGIFAKWWPADLQGKKQFKAHLLGFRGIGSAAENPFFDRARVRALGTGICPAVILRLEDGRKRCFTRGSFSDEDQAYILALYEKEMVRIRGTLEAPPEKIPPEIESRWPVSELYKPGTFRVESDRFVISSGAEEPDDGIPGVWINKVREKDSEAHRAATLRAFEDYWAYNEYSGHLMPFWEKPVRYKYSVVYGGTKVNGLELLGRGNGGGYGGCGTACWEGLYHEWGHGFGSDPMVLLGGGETRCDALQTMADPTLVRKVSFQINRPYKNFFWGQYPGGFGYTMIGDDLNWGYAAVTSFPCLTSETENTPMHVMARLGQERGIWENGIRGLGDFLGQVAARYAEYDYELEAMLREAYPTPNRANLVALDRAKGLYRSSRTEAPEPFGFNVVRLMAEPGAKSITVDFQGLYDPDTFSDWRACLVAVGANGRPRYSPLWNKGRMSLETREGDKRYWLTVTATPYALAPGQLDGGNKINHIYQGGFAYKYPYEVQLTGCRPANPNAPIGVNENMALVGPTLMARADANLENCGQGDWPHPSDTPEYAEMKQSLEHLAAKAPAMLKLVMHPDLFNDAVFCPIANAGSLRLRAAGSAVFLEWRAKWLLENAQGARHPNGGGWVAKTAKVAPTAYVGPECMVLDGAQVLDHAIIEDYAMVSGPKVLIKDHARVYGKAVVCGDVTMTGYARVTRNIINRASKMEWNKQDPTAPPYRFQILTGVPVKRDGPEERTEVFKNAGFKLQANYAFDRPETVLLEDWYQEHSLGAFAFGAHSTDLIFYDGVLRGQPGFIEDGDVRAFTFDGKDQYAEADPAVADLGAITIDLAFKRMGEGQQTVFDFGSSCENRFMLTLSATGAPALVMVQNGRSETLEAAQPVPAGQWTNCRVEIDGERIRLWVDGQKVAEKVSTFRAADVFPAGAEKRNFIAATRELKDFFNGAIDYLRIYFTVYQDFTKAPAPPMVSSRRIDPDFMERFDKAFAGYEVKEARYKDDVKKTEIYRFYEQWIKRVDARIAELGNSEEVSKFEQEQRSLEGQLEKRKRELGTEFDQRPENQEKRKRSDELEKKRQERFRQLQQASPEFLAARKEMDEARKLRESIEHEARKGIEAELKALNEQRGQLNRQRDAVIEGIQKADPDCVKNRQEHQAVLKELTAADVKPDANRQKELRDRERQLNDELGRLRHALLRDNPDWRHLEQAGEALHAKERELLVNATSRDPRFGPAQLAEQKVQQKFGEIERRLWADGELVAMQNEREGCNTWHAREASISKSIAPLALQINQFKARIKNLRTETALARNPDEYNALTALGWGKDQYRYAIEERLKSTLLPLMPEDKTQMRQAAPFQMGTWSTTVDWEGRTRWELSSQELSPIMKRWLKRMKPQMYP